MVVAPFSLPYWLCLVYAGYVSFKLLCSYLYVLKLPLNTN